MCIHKKRKRETDSPKKIQIDENERGKFYIVHLWFGIFYIDLKVKIKRTACVSNFV